MGKAPFQRRMYLPAQKTTQILQILNKAWKTFVKQIPLFYTLKLCLLYLQLS